MKLTEEKKNKLIEKMQDFRKKAEDCNADIFKRMSKCERFKIGKQWDAADLEYNKSHRKHSLTINRILPTVLQIDGYEIQNPRDIKAFNIKGGTKTIADLKSALIKHTLDCSHAHKVKTQMFDDGNTTARGWLGLDLDYSYDPLQGDLVVKKYDPFMVLPYPVPTSYDVNAEVGGCLCIIVDDWVNKELIHKSYPDLKDEIADANYTPTGKKQTWYGKLASMMTGTRGAGAVKDDYRDTTDTEENPVDMTEDNYRVSTYWFKEFMAGAYLQQLSDPLNFIVLTDEKDIKKAKDNIEAQPNIARLVEKDRRGNPLVVGVLRKSVMIGDILLEYDDEPLFGVNTFPLVRYAPYFQNGYEFGIVDNLIGPQEEVNWSHSMMLNLVRLLANAGWKVGRATQKTIDWLTEHGTEDGVVINETDYGGKVEKLLPNPLPTQFEYITESGSKHINEIANVRLEEPTRDEQKLSGKAIALKQQGSFTGSAVLFSNYDYSIQLFGQLIDEVITRAGIYSDDEIMAIVDEQDLIDPLVFEQAKKIIIDQLKSQGQQIPEPPPMPNAIAIQTADPRIQEAIVKTYRTQMDVFEQFVTQVEESAKPIAKQIILKMLKDVAKGRYGIKVDLAPMAQTMQIVRSMELMELNQALINSGQAPIGRKFLIEASNVANKEEIIADQPPVVIPVKKTG